MIHHVAKFRIFQCNEANQVSWYEIQYKIGWFWKWIMTIDCGFEKERTKFNTLDEAVEECHRIGKNYTKVVCSIRLITEL